jgi:hypothetical protein
MGSGEAKRSLEGVRGMNTGKGDKKEKEYYETIKTKLIELFREKVGDRVYLEITANRTFSNKLKSEVPNNRNIIFPFLREFAPDITGFIKGEYSSDFIVIEVKTEAIKLEHIYQSRKYQDLFDSKFTFLISLQPIPEEIKRLHKTIYTLLYHPSIFLTFVLVHFDDKSGNFVEWYPEDPFEKNLYWQL